MLTRRGLLAGALALPAAGGAAGAVGVTANPAPNQSVVYLGRLVHCPQSPAGTRALAPEHWVIKACRGRPGHVILSAWGCNGRRVFALVPSGAFAENLPRLDDQKFVAAALRDGGPVQ